MTWGFVSWHVARIESGYVDWQRVCVCVCLVIGTWVYGKAWGGRAGRSFTATTTTASRCWLTAGRGHVGHGDGRRGLWLPRTTPARVPAATTTETALPAGHVLLRRSPPGSGNLWCVTGESRNWIYFHYPPPLRCPFSSIRRFRKHILVGNTL